MYITHSPSFADLSISESEWNKVELSVKRAAKAFVELQKNSYSDIENFYLQVAQKLKDPILGEIILKANRRDCEKARNANRPLGRLELSDLSLNDMAQGVEAWIKEGNICNKVIESYSHDGWEAQLVSAPLGVIGFVFEGRPNVLVDALGVLTGKNTAVLRIGSDALGTAQSLLATIISPCLKASGLPDDTIVIVDSINRESAVALCAQTKLSLMVVRGSGEAVTKLGAIARSRGIATSLHGTGGAWMCLSLTANEAFAQECIACSLDRKVCNTLNVILVPIQNKDFFAAVINRALKEVLDRDSRLKVLVHAVPDIFPQLQSGSLQIDERIVVESCDMSLLSHEFEWDSVPEIAVATYDSLNDAVALFNTLSPQFVASLISEDQEEQDFFYASVNAPFLGNGMTRWVDGFYTLGRPELGLSNWQQGRIFGRSGFLSASSLYTVRVRMKQTTQSLCRKM